MPNRKMNRTAESGKFVKYGAVVLALTGLGVIALGSHGFDPEVAVADALLHKAVACRMELNDKHEDFGPRCQEYARFKNFLVGKRLVNKWSEELGVDALDHPSLDKRTNRLIVLDQIVNSEQRLADKRKACLAGAQLEGCATVEQLLPSYVKAK